MKKLVFIHGAFGTEKDLKPLSDLCSGFQTELILLPFHGVESGERFNYRSLKDSLLKKLQTHKNYSIFGYSMGGYLAIDLASQFKIAPDSITTYGTRFFWNEELVKNIALKMNPDTLAINLPEYVIQLEKMHGKFWKNIISDSIILMNDIAKYPLTKNDFNLIRTRVKMIVGDKDVLASPDETKKVPGVIENSQVEILENGEHDINKLNQSMLKRIATYLQ